MEILLLEAVFADFRKMIEPKGVQIIIPRPSVCVHIITRFHMALESALHFTNYHLGTEMAHVSRCAVKPY